MLEGGFKHKTRVQGTGKELDQVLLRSDQQDAPVRSTE